MATLTDRNTRDFCSITSVNGGDDPAGSARFPRLHLFIEAPMPWPKPFLDAAGLPPGVRDVLSEAEGDGVDAKALGLGPDEEYSEPGHTRLLCFRRPDPPFSAFDRTELLLPTEQAADAVHSLLREGELPEMLQTYARDPGDVRDLMVCTHGATDACCGTFGYPVYEWLRNEWASPSLRVWRTSHTGGHRYAPTMLDFPEGRYWGHLDRDAAEVIVARAGMPAYVVHCYRGWAGFGLFEQVAEQEILTREGWEWFGYLKSARTTVDGTAHTAPAWHGESETGEVRIDFQSLDGGVTGAYEATIVQAGTAMIGGCGKPPQP
ncbi:MAG: sucrase ferredoxin, partial [Chloroflexota bacterium]